MGLFSRNNAGGAGQDDFDEMDLPTSDDLKGGLFTAEENPQTNAAAPSPSSPAPVRRSAPSRGGYGIEDAIKLMRSLPRDNNEVVVTVVKKTLESTNIQVTDIVEDANQKETNIRNQHKTLEGEIKELQDQIAHRNQQISDLLQDLKETTDVRQRLQLAMELDGQRAAAAQPAKSQAKAEAQNATPAQAATTATPQTAQAATPSVDPNARRRSPQRTNPPH